ncbi:hypothetical protein PIB30_015903 [Stylosanthes scabra]|uniref:F-box domain-containing protein n=1 Tax=Stylosanthes scabra TaxID=79078 RepID=A0ABU6T8W7_9FABA|nr:hypothetical protein [Stylosanthes scabra]
MSEFSSSAEAIEGNNCLLTQVLICLPLKDVITLKRVSKRWRSLISTLYFRRCHLTIKTRVSGLFLHPGNDSLSSRFKFFSFDKKSHRPTIPADLDPSLQILESCNGLMLVRNQWNNNFLSVIPPWETRKPFPRPRLLYWICNENRKALRFDLNKECVKDDLPLLPSLPAECYRFYRYALALACGYMNLVGHADSNREFYVSVFQLKKEDNSLRWVLTH